MHKSASMRLAALTLFSTYLCSAQCTTGPTLVQPNAAARILEQATWGPTPASLQQLECQGLQTWFNNQVNPAVTPITTYANQPMLNSAGTAFTNISGVQVQFFENALNNPDQLRQRVAFALSEIWVASHVTVAYAAGFPPLLNIFQQDAFANYGKLINDVTLNPAMGQFLDMVNNHKATATSSPNENYGREVMQLFTIGLNVLNPNGTPQTDTNGVPIPTYTPATVVGITNALTGWTYAATAAGGTSPNLYNPMVPQTNQHDETAKVIPFNYPGGKVVNISLAAAQTAAQDLYGTLDANGVPTGGVVYGLMQNPSMAPFISKQLIQHLVTSNPSTTYVQDVATVFTNTQGNLQAVVWAILDNPEARAGDTAVADESASFGHLREPVLLIENLLRGFGGTVFDSSTVYNYTSNLGQNLFVEPSVFSYFSPQYGIAGGLLAPEFQLHTTQTAVLRANYIYSAIYNGHLDANTMFTITPFVTAATTSTAALETLISNTFFHGMMSASLQSGINSALTSLTTPTSKAQAALYLALTSSEYQIIH